jgi:hypothetical protein
MDWQITDPVIFFHVSRKFCSGRYRPFQPQQTRVLALNIFLRYLKERVHDHSQLAESSY